MTEKVPMRIHLSVSPHMSLSLHLLDTPTWIAIPAQGAGDIFFAKGTIQGLGHDSGHGK